MKRLIFLFPILFLLAGAALAQTPEPTPRPEPVRKAIVNIRPPRFYPVYFQANKIAIKEVDGTPSFTDVRTIIVSNGTLTGNNQTVTLVTGGGSPGGAAGTIQYNNAGALGGISGCTSDGTNLTCGSGNLRATSPRITTSILDANGNIHLALTATGSAVNYLTYANAAAAGGPTITATGSDTNIPINILAKGTTGDVIVTGRSLTFNRVSDNATIWSYNGTDTTNFASSVAIANGGHLILGSTARLYSPTGAVDVSIIRHATATWRISNSTTGAGNLLIGTSAGAIGTSGAGVLAFTLSTAPSSSPTDTVQLYSNDAAAGAHELYTRNEAGAIERQTGLCSRNSAQFDKTSDTTLANITGLSLNVEASRIYKFEAVLFTTSNVAGGVKAAISGTATATSIVYEGVNLDNGVTVNSRTTTLGNTVGASTTVTAAHVVIRGTIVVNAAGTLTTQFAQNASNGAASSVLINSNFCLTPIG